MATSTHGMDHGVHTERRPHACPHERRANGINRGRNRHLQMPLPALPCDSALDIVMLVVTAVACAAEHTESHSLLIPSR